MKKKLLVRNLKELTTTRLVNAGFFDLYKRTLLNEALTDEDKIKILSIAIVLTNHSDAKLKQLGYRIVLAYGNNTEDYEPLYDLSISSGLMPVSSTIRFNFSWDENDFFSEFTDCYSQIYKNGNITYTEQQYLLNDFFKENANTSVSIIAPTSYGKSELITSLMQTRQSQVCIIVPSKSLLAQTKKRVLDANVRWVNKVITHSDMYRPEEKNLVFVLTQERLSRLLHENKELKFDLTFIDEAHNILSNDNRNTLLASTLSIIRSRNPDTAFKFLTPFLMDHNNLQLRHADIQISNFKVTEYIKSERLYLSDFRTNKKCHYLYDQFINKFIDHGETFSDHIDLIKKKALRKNLIYFNKPKDIENFCLKFINELDDVRCDVINIACAEIESYTNEHYSLIKCLKKGIVYHHGSIPEVIKSYIENVFIRSTSLKYLVTSSTLLEGVNIPLERAFILDNKKGASLLTPSQFKNLLGRVARFSEVFNEQNIANLTLLEPSIFLIGTNEYSSAKANLRNFLQRSMDVHKEPSDKLENTLLENTYIDEKNRDELKKTEERLENLEPGTVDQYEGEYATTEIGHLLFANNITEIDIFKYETAIKELLDSHANTNGPILDAETVVSVIISCFIAHTENASLERLKTEAAIRFYTMFLSWKLQNLSFKELIARTAGYWQQIDPVARSNVYVGKWGDQIYGDGFRELWTNINTKTPAQIVNLAIVRIKEEEDFFDFNLFKFIDVLNDYGLVDKNFYLQLKYGTTDKNKIKLIREGFSKTLSELMLTKYVKHLSFDSFEGVHVDSKILVEMRVNEEKEMLTFEAQLNIKET